MSSGTTSPDDDNVLLVHGAAVWGNRAGRMLEIYDDKNDEWYSLVDSDFCDSIWPHYRVLGHVGKRLYSIIEPSQASIDCLDLETLTVTKDIAAIPFPIFVTVMGDRIYTYDHYNITCFNMKDHSVKEITEFFTTKADGTWDCPILSSYNGIIYGLTGDSGLTYNVETGELKTLENVGIDEICTYDDMFRAIDYKNKLYLLPKFYQKDRKILIFNPKDNQWNWTRPKCYSPFQGINEYDDYWVIHHNGKILITGEYSDIHEYDIENNTIDYYCRDYNGPLTRFEHIFSVKRSILRKYMN